MSRKKMTAKEAEFTLFDVVYEDGTRKSNRRVPTALLGGLDKDDPARAAIEEQDEAIAKRSGQPRIPIIELIRSR